MEPCGFVQRIFILALISSCTLCKLALALREGPKELKKEKVPGEVTPLPPVFPETFEVIYNFSLPYESSIQPDGLTYPVHVWRDAANGRIRMDTYDGLNTLIQTKDGELEVVPRLDKLVCYAYEPESDEDSLLNTPVLPDVSTWTYAGSSEVNGVAASAWEHDETHGRKHTQYIFYIAEDGRPLRLHMFGNDIFSGSHFDEYVVDYVSFTPGPIDAAVFAAPAICKGVKAIASGRPPAFQYRMAALLPSIRYGGDDAEYAEFAATYGRRHASPAEYEHRRATFRANLALIEAHNAANDDLKLAVNRFADWTQEEYEAIMLPLHGRPREGQLGKHHKKKSHAIKHERLLPKSRVPRTLSWRGTGADWQVKDQATCGSCWAFAAAGALQGAYYLATGKNVSLSEQQLMDCSWGYGGCSACDGGWAAQAMEYAVDAGGVALEAGYEYRGQDNYCEGKGAHKAAKFKGYSFVPEQDDEALMEAIASRGPVAVAIDASQPTFRFYSHGVYDDPKCLWEDDDLDHAVLAVGYGTTARSGHDYWLIRNSWSERWGDGGYIKIGRGHHACGVTTEPVYAIFDKAVKETGFDASVSEA